MDYKKFEQQLETHKPTALYNPMCELPLDLEEFCGEYFPEKKDTWLYRALRGYDSAMQPIEPLTAEELERLKGGLCDLADRLRRVADTIQTGSQE